MQELVEYITKSLVDDPEQIHVRVMENAHTVNVELQVAPSDMGRIIGKGGRVVNSLRTLVRIAAVRQGKRATLEILDSNGNVSHPNAASLHHA
ncbi:MAG: hypothetical protein B6D41_08910 [Chloroflexi bacterium UTCFX4]|nr:MAG: hypothetical protein B6D41_08910 [Chloroflexi bacterium UTCFX4]